MNGFPWLSNLIHEVQSVERRTKREAESAAAIAADKKEYNISPESRAALERGDRQRESGMYAVSWAAAEMILQRDIAVPRYVGRYLGTLSAHWPRKNSEYMTERQAFWQIRSVMGTVFPSDYGKRVYESDDVIQVENDEQRDKRLALLRVSTTQEWADRK